MTTLREAVERTVRPVRATELRKNRMREELLGHLSSLYEVELARTSDENQAVTAAIARFGPLEELTRELQRSVPVVERALWYRLPIGQWTERRSGETSGQYFWRVGRWSVAIMTTFLALLTLSILAIPIVRQSRPRGDEPRIWQLLLFMAILLLVYSIVVIAMPIGCEYLRTVWSRYCSSRGAVRMRAMLMLAVTFGALAAVAGCGAGAVFLALPVYLQISAVCPAALTYTIAAAASLSVPLVAVQAWQQGQAARQFADWDGTESGT